MIPEEEKSTFQRLIANEEQAEEMLDDLNSLEVMVPGDDGPEFVQSWELVVSFGVEDVPYLQEELEELVDGGG